MPKDAILKGATSVLDEIFIQNSSSTTGAGLTGLTSASSGLVCYRGREDDGNAGGTAISLTSTGTLGTWASGWFKEKDATNMPGVYEIGYTNATLATGSRKVTLIFMGATNMAPLVIQIKLTGTDDQNATTGGIGALPATACTTNASLLTSGTGTDQVSVSAGKVVLQATQTGVTIPTVTNLTNAPTAGDLTATMKTSVATAALTTQMTESYRGTGAAPTLAQAQMELLQHEGQASIASTTKTLKKLDGSTTAKTFTLNSATTPTSVAEAS